MTFDLVGVGEPLVAFLPDRIGPLRAVPTFERAMAGAECNVLIGATRLGLRCALASRVGHDEFRACYVAPRHCGEPALTFRTSLSIPTRPPASTSASDQRSATAPNPSTTAPAAPRAASRPGQSWLTLTEHCALFLTTGITALLSQSAHDAVGEALTRARRAEATIVFDPNLRKGLWGSDRAAELLVPLLQHVDIYIGGEEETRALLNTSAEDVELAARVAQHGPSEVVIKRAQLGAVAVIGGAAHSQPPYPTGLTDAIGAGDAFAAGYLAVRTRHGSTTEALRAGAVCGAAVCAGGGDWETFRGWRSCSARWRPGRSRRADLSRRRTGVTAPRPGAIVTSAASRVPSRSPSRG